MRWGVGAGASRLVSGTMTIHRRLEERLAAFEGSEACLLFGSGYLANTGVIGALARRRRRGLLRRAEPRLDHRRLPALARRGLRVPPPRYGAPRVGAAPPAARGAAPDRDRLGLLDGRRRRAARGDRRAGPASTTRAWSSTRPTPPARSARAAAARSPRRASRARSTCSSARSARRSAPTAPSCACERDGPLPRQPGAHAHLLDRACAAGGRRSAGRARAARGTAPASTSSPRNAARSASALAAEGFAVGELAMQIVPLVVGDERAGCGLCRRRSLAACSPRRSARRRSPPGPRGCGWP